jgi:hypothetical protein
MAAVALPHLHVDVMREIFESFTQRIKRPTSDDDALDPTAASELATFARVCREWQSQACAVLWQDITRALANDGYFAPDLLRTLRHNVGLASCVRTLHVTSTLEGALWQSAMTNEGDVFAALVAACPNLEEVVVPSFEVASCDHVLAALRNATQIRRFTIRCILLPAFYSAG